MTYNERLQDIWHQYTDEHGGVPATLQEAVEWGAKEGLIQAPKIDPFAKVIDDMRRALREERRTDPMGQSVPRQYSLRGWSETASRSSCGRYLSRHRTIT